MSVDPADVIATADAYLALAAIAEADDPYTAVPRVVVGMDPIELGVLLAASVQLLTLAVPNLAAGLRQMSLAATARPDVPPEPYRPPSP